MRFETETSANDLIQFAFGIPLGHLVERDRLDAARLTGRAERFEAGDQRRVAVKIADRAKDMSGKFPNIVIQNT